MSEPGRLPGGGAHGVGSGGGGGLAGLEATVCVVGGGRLAGVAAIPDRFFVRKGAGTGQGPASRLRTSDHPTPDRLVSPGPLGGGS